MSRFQRLADAEARTLTRAELLDRIEAEQNYWAHKRGRTAENLAAEREFSQILHTYLPLADALQAARDVLEGRESTYWETRPGGAPEAGELEAGT